MRWLVGLLFFLLALGTLRAVGCGGEEPECRTNEDCEDANECTYDACDPRAGECVYIWVENTFRQTSCDDGDDNECTTGECNSGACESRPANCSDDNPCTEDSCDPVTGCNHAAYPDGTECGCLYWGGDCGPWICIGFCEPCHCSRYGYCRNGECGPEGSGGRAGAGGTGGMGGSAG